MKFVTFAAVLLVSVSSFARSIMPLQYSFSSVVINGEETQYEATAYIHGNEIYVNVFAENACPPGKFCAAVVGQTVASFSAPITEAYGECGSNYFRAFEDKRPVDGLQVEISLADHRTRVCHDMIKEAIQLHATVAGPWSHKPTIYELSK